MNKINISSNNKAEQPVEQIDKTAVAPQPQGVVAAHQAHGKAEKKDSSIHGIDPVGHPDGEERRPVDGGTHPK